MVERLGSHRGLVLWTGIILLPLAVLVTASVFHKSDAPHDSAIDAFDSIAWPREPRVATQASSSRSSSVAPVESLIAGLAARLENEPDDAKGWALLAQSHAFLGDIENAESALAKAVALGLDEAELRQRVAMARSEPIEMFIPAN